MNSQASKSTTFPIICGVSLAAMVAAGLSHWWSVGQFIAAVETGIPISDSPAPQDKPAPDPLESSSKPTRALAKANATKTLPAVAAPHTGQQQFYEALITKMDNLQSQNRDLLDQLAETNRDVMKLEFRVDTHSESFRPLPVTEDRPFTSIMDDGPGVLPPRAEPVMLPAYE